MREDLVDGYKDSYFSFWCATQVMKVCQCTKSFNLINVLKLHMYFMHYKMLISIFHHNTHTHAYTHTPKCVVSVCWLPTSGNRWVQIATGTFFVLACLLAYQCLEPLYSWINAIYKSSIYFFGFELHIAKNKVYPYDLKMACHVITTALETHVLWASTSAGHK